jgi:hypothetical protein
MRCSLTPEIHDVGSVWQTLEASDGRSKTHLDAAPVGVVLVAGEVLAGIDSGGDRHLLFPLREGEAFLADANRANVRMVGLKLNGRQYASVVCALRDLDEIFTQFCRELLGSLASSDSPARAARDSLDQWRRLFADPNSDLLSERAQVGLFGELVTLHAVLQFQGPNGLSVWTGPDGSQHDFRARELACEVKATLAREGRRVSISSLDQLAAPQGSELYLIHYRLELHPKGQTLSELLVEIRALAGGPELEKKLHQIGYRGVDEDHYTSRYIVVESRTYLVDDDFPRIVPASFLDGGMPPGVESLEYVIQISNEPPYPLSADASFAVLANLAKS